MIRSFVYAAMALVVAGLVTACSSTYYKAYETFGVYKRDLLKKKVAATRDEEQKVQADFTNALTRLKAITGFEGGELEKQYRDLQSRYDSAASRVQAVHGRIQQVETVARDLFAEWQTENQQIGTPSLRTVSDQQLQDTRKRYEDLVTALKKAEASMDPVLGKFHDYVLALKHSLNAQAVAALQGESLNIQAEIRRLIDEMNASIAQADAFIKQLPK